MTLLTVQNLSVTDVRDQSPVLRNVSFTLQENSCLGIVGESGSGKSMTVKALLGLVQPWLRVEGRADFCTEQGTVDLLQQDEDVLRRIRGQQICFILQDAMSAFNPLADIGSQMAETFCENQQVSRAEALTMARAALARINMPQPGQVLQKYPCQLSGGMLQRCMVATALAMQPAVIVADEPTTALDSINQRQVIEEFALLRQQTGMALIFISHDLGVVQHLADQLLVMHDGQIVESGDTKAVFRNPQQEYTRFLIERRLQMSRNFQKAMTREAGR